jgi:hypothetical protein
MAQYEDITIDQGSDLTVTLEVVNYDGSAKNLTNYSVAAKMKKTYNSDSDDTVIMGTTIDNPATTGNITLNLTNIQTGALKAPYRYVYDVEISHVDSDAALIVERILEGKAHVTPSVTR